MRFSRRRRVVQAATLAVVMGAATPAFCSDKPGPGVAVCLDYWFSGDHIAFTGGSSKPDGAGGGMAEYRFTARVWPGKPAECEGSTLAEHTEATIVGTWDQPSKTAREVITYAKPWSRHGAPISRSESVVRCVRDPWTDKTYQECAVISTKGTLPDAQRSYPVSAFRIGKDEKGRIATAGSPQDLVQGESSPAAAADFCAQYQPGPIPALRRGGFAAIPMKIADCGRLGWNTGNPKDLKGVILEYHWLLGATALAQDGVGTDVGAVAAGATVAVKGKLKAPAKAGSYTLRWDLRLADGTWFSGKGAAFKEQKPVTIR